MFSAAYITHTCRWELEKIGKKESGRYWPNLKRWRSNYIQARIRTKHFPYISQGQYESFRPIHFHIKIKFILNLKSVKYKNAEKTGSVYA